jgi:Fe2+ transport system protein B
MAKPFGKRPANWLTIGQAQELITSLSAKTGIPVLELVAVNQGDCRRTKSRLKKYRTNNNSYFSHYTHTCSIANDISSIMDLYYSAF